MENMRSVVMNELRGVIHLYRTDVDGMESLSG